MNTLESHPVALDRLVTHAELAYQPKEVPAGYEASAPYIAIPSGYKMERLPYTPEAPSRIRAHVSLDDHSSFCRYVTEQKTQTTRIFATVTDDGGFFEAVLDYHGEHGEKPSHASHWAKFTPAKSTPWNRWMGKNNQAMSQEEFATFLEDNLLDINEPSGAVLLQIVNTLTISGNLTFSRAQRLQDGTSTLHFANEQRAAGGGGQLAIPAEFVLLLPVFDGEPPSVLTARLRYKLSNEGVISFRFQLVNPHLVVREAMNQLNQRIVTGTGLTPWCGRYTCKQNAR